MLLFVEVLRQFRRHCAVHI